tara:strand:+ start:441 stop:629 length:189 start_codon:yes stop_codon:yes gene_type:complete
MKVKILKIFGSIIILIFINCTSETDKCAEFTIDELAENICELQTPYNECLKEIKEYLDLSCN